MKTKAEKQEHAKQKREVLKSISRKARKLRDIKTQLAKNVNEALYWQSKTINEILFLTLYRKGEAQEFKTFWQWKAEGKTIKKGEHAVLIWGQPIKAKKKNEQEPTQEDEFELWPVCYLFSNLQVV